MSDCVDIIDYAEFFEVPPYVALGALINPDCAACDGMRPYVRIHRDGIYRNLRRAITTLEKKLGIPLCAREYSQIIDPRDCPVKLKHPVIAMGKKQLIGTGVYDICYTSTSGCGETAVDCPDLERVGQIVVDNIPDGWDGDMSLVEFEYDTTCSRTDQSLTDPCFDYSCCEDTQPCPVDCGCEDRNAVVTAVTYEDGSVSLTLADPHTLLVGDRISLWSDDSGLPLIYKFVIQVDGQDIYVDGGDFDPSVVLSVTTAQFIATWYKWALVHPYVDQAQLSHWSNKSCTEILDGFARKVVVNFYEIDQTAAIEPISMCTCDDCDICYTCSTCDTLPEYEYELDIDTGELCFTQKSNCGCHKPHYLKIHYIAGYNELPSDLLAAVILRAFLYQPGIRCGCDDHDRKLEWWAEIDPSTDNLPLANPNAWPYGRTRAGVELGRLLDAHRDEEVRIGHTERASSGFFTSRKIGLRGKPLTRR